MSGAHNTRFVGNVLCDDRNKIRVAVSIMELAIKGVVQFLYDLYHYGRIIRLKLIMQVLERKERAIFYVVTVLEIKS